MIARDIVVHGRVQGVYFRASTCEAARAAGASGWVRNEPDGTVRVHVEGPEDVVAAVLDFVADGPPDARVDRVDVTDGTVEGHAGFDLR